LSLPAPQSEFNVEAPRASVDMYENRLSVLMQQLQEEGENHKQLLSERESRIQELQDAIASVTAGGIDPEEESKTMALEERIVEMTILIEEKDRRIFHLESEIVQLKEEVTHLRQQVDRIPELENTINNLDNTLATIRKLSIPDPMDSQEVGESSDESETSEGPDDDFVVELRAKISSLEMTIMDLDRLVISLRTEKDSMTAERDSAMELLRQKEEQFRMEMEEVMRTHAEELKVNDETITSLRDKIFSLQDKLEVAEMAKISLTSELEMEQAKRMTTTTAPTKPQMVSRPVSPLPVLTESVPTIAPTPVITSPEVVPVITATPQMMSPKIMSPKIASPVAADDNLEEVETEGGSTFKVPERIKAIIDRQREQIEELNFELIALRLKVAEEMISPSGKRILGDSAKSTPSDQFVIPHRDLVPLSPRPGQQPVSPSGCTGCFPSMFKKKRTHILV
jgi:hypothetical protein